MLSRTSLALGLFATCAVACVPRLYATTADDAGARVVVPYVQYDKGSDARLFVENHEVRDVEVQLRFVGERASASPGLKVCGKFLLPAGSLSTFDLRASCGLAGLGDLGMAQVLVTNPSGLARVSARGRQDLLDPSTGLLLQTLFVNGLPFGALETTDEIHVASGLRSDPTGLSGRPSNSDCFLGSFTDGSGAGGLIARLGLRDRAGQPLGSDRFLSLPPNTLVRVQDVFKAVGAPAGAYDDVRAAFFLGGLGDAALGYCLTVEPQATKGARTQSLALAQVADSRDETRRRSASASSTPEAQGGASFRIDPSNTRVLHGIFVRHPDRLSCGLGATGDRLLLKAVSPDRSIITAGTSSSTGWFDAGPHGALQNGFDDLWGLEVSWDPSAARTAPVSYTLSCLSGNGVSLADELVRN